MERLLEINKELRKLYYERDTLLSEKYSVNVGKAFKMNDLWVYVDAVHGKNYLTIEISNDGISNTIRDIDTPVINDEFECTVSQFREKLESEVSKIILTLNKKEK